MKNYAYGVDDCIELSEKNKHLTRFTNNKFVYVIAYSDWVVKVGITTNFKQRLSSLRNGRDITNCFAVLSGDGAKVESLSHTELDEHRLNGEYFSCEFLTAVNCVIKNKVEPLILSDSEIEKIKTEEDAKFNKFINYWERGKEMTIDDCRAKANEWIENKRSSLGDESWKYSFLTTTKSSGVVVSVSFIDDVDTCNDLKELMRVLELTDNDLVEDCIWTAYLDLIGHYEIDEIKFNKSDKI
jgi:hypothetical protein